MDVYLGEHLATCWEAATHCGWLWQAPTMPLLCGLPLLFRDLFGGSTRPCQACQLRQDLDGGCAALDLVQVQLDGAWNVAKQAFRLVDRLEMDSDDMYGSTARMLRAQALRERIGYLQDMANMASRSLKYAQVVAKAREQDDFSADSPECIEDKLQVVCCPAAPMLWYTRRPRGCGLLCSDTPALRHTRARTGMQPPTTTTPRFGARIP